MNLETRATRQGVQMRRKAEKPESSRQVYYTTPRVQDMIDTIGRWAERQGLTATRMQRETGKVGYSATFAVQTSLEWWAREIRSTTRYTIDEMRPYLLEYYTAIYIDERKRTSTQLKKPHLDALDKIYTALKRSNIPFHYSDAQANNILIITTALARMAASVDESLDPLFPPTP